MPGSAGPAFGSSGQHSIQPLSLFDPGMIAQRLEAREVASDIKRVSPEIRVARVCKPRRTHARIAWNYGTEADMLAEALKTLKLGKTPSRSKAMKKEGKKPASRKAKGKSKMKAKKTSDSRKKQSNTMDMDALRKALASLESKPGGTK